ncbi:MAG: glycine cleavage system protein H [Chlamydiota bacterium]
MKTFTETEEWFEIEGNIATVGVSQTLQKEIGEVVYIQIPPVGTDLIKDQEAVILESTKAALDTYAPISGRIVAINKKVLEDPSIVNKDPEKEGWLYKIEICDEEKS